MLSAARKLSREAQASFGVYQPTDQDVYGVLAEFAHPGDLYHVAEATRDAGYKHFDTHSPFPIHGMDDAMGIRPSILGPIVFGGTVTGLLAGVLLQWWTGGVDYPINIAGKPFFALESSVPVIFELTILFSALAAVVGMLALNGLPRPYNPLFYSERFRKASDDGFFLHIAASDALFDEQDVEAFLKDHGAVYTETIYDRPATASDRPSNEEDVQVRPGGGTSVA